MVERALDYVKTSKTKYSLYLLNIESELTLCSQGDLLLPNDVRQAASHTRPNQLHSPYITLRPPNQGLLHSGDVSLSVRVLPPCSDFLTFAALNNPMASPQVSDL